MKKSKNTKVLFILFLITFIVVIITIFTKKDSSEKNINEIAKKPIVEKNNEDKKEEIKEITSPKNETLPEQPSLPQKDERLSDTLKKFNLTMIQYNQLKVKIIAKNYRYKIKEITLNKRNPDQSIEVSLKLEASDTPYYISALIDQKSGLILKTWGQTRYEIPEPPVITLPAK